MGNYPHKVDVINHMAARGMPSYKIKSIGRQMFMKVGLVL
jgi:hypothetical protein